MRLFFFFNTVLLCCGLFGKSLAGELNYDIRVLIDVTGSMQQNDPDNSRSAALRLIGGIMPEDAYAGVWTFGRYVNNEVKWGKVDQFWRQDVEQASQQLYASGRYADIEKALARASTGWSQVDENSRRAILLLSDGKVHVSSKPGKNEKSRNAILQTRLKALRAAGASVHSIAMSPQADADLLQRLAVQSGGSFTRLPAQADLAPAFYRVIEQIIEPDQVVTQDDSFLLDQQVEKMTLIAFRKSADAALSLLSPGEQLMTALQPGKAQWRSENGFELVTIDSPAVGSWKIESPGEIETHLLIESGLSLSLTTGPRRIMPADAVELIAGLAQGGERIDKFNFLSFVEFGLTHRQPNGSQTRYPMKASSQLANKGLYLFRGQGSLAPGLHRFSVSAQGPGFNRSKSIDVEVGLPVEVNVESGNSVGSYQFSISALEPFLQAGSLKAIVELETPDGSRSPLELQNTPERIRGSLDTGKPGIYKLHIRVSGINHDGGVVEVDLGSWPVEGVASPAPGQTQKLD